MGARAVTVNEVLGGHVQLDLECLDRLYLNGYVPALQVGGQVVTFLHGHLGKPVASPAVIEQIGTRFRQAVARFAEDNDIPMVKFRKGIRKADVMRPLLARAAHSAGRRWWRSAGRRSSSMCGMRASAADQPGAPQFSYAMAERRVTCYYFYVWDERWGPGFIKVCAYFPYPVKVYPLTELRREASRSGERVVGCGSTVPARDRIWRGAGPGGSGGASGGGFAGDGSSVRAVPAG